MLAFFHFVRIVAYVGTVLRYVMAGRLSPEAAAVLLVVLVALLAAGHAMGTGLLGLILRVGLPLGSAAALIAYYSSGDPQAMRQAAVYFLTLAIMLFGLYVMFRAVFPGQDRRRYRNRPRMHQGIEIRYRRSW